MAKVIGKTLRWSPDGKRLAVNQSDEEDPGGLVISLLEVDPITGKAKPMPGKRWRTIRDFVWLPDGSGLLLAAQDKSGVTDQLWLTAYPGGERRRISNDLMVYSSVSVYRYKGRPEKRRRRQETKCALFSVLECNRDATLSALWPLATLSSPREKPGKNRGKNEKKLLSEQTWGVRARSRNCWRDRLRFCRQKQQQGASDYKE